jgi:hypothetical protein
MSNSQSEKSSNINNNLSIVSNQNSKLMGTYGLSAIEPINRDVWKKITNNSKNGLMIKLSDISDANRIEIKTIANKIIDLVANKLERKTAFEKASKTGVGYTLQLRCFTGTKRSRSACCAHWSVRISIITKEINVYCTNCCDHLLSSVPGKFFSS